MEHDRFLHEIKHLNVYIIYMTAVNIIDLSTELCDARCLFHFSFVWSIHGKCHASRDAHALFVTSFQSMLWSSMKILTWDSRVKEDFHGNFTTSKMLFINTFEFSSLTGRACSPWYNVGRSASADSGPIDYSSLLQCCRWAGAIHGQWSTGSIWFGQLRYGGLRNQQSALSNENFCPNALATKHRAHAGALDALRRQLRGEHSGAFCHCRPLSLPVLLRYCFSVSKYDPSRWTARSALFAPD